MSRGDEPVVGDARAEKKAAGTGIAMPTNAVVVCSAVGLLGLVAVILGVAGEDATVQALVGEEPDGFFSVKCVYQATPALGLGVAAGLLALTAQVVVTVAGVFFVFGRCRNWDFPKETGRRLGVALFSFSWVLAIIAMALFFAGAAMNTDHDKHSNTDKCTLNPGSPMFAAATVLALVTAALQIASYILLQPPQAPETKLLAMTEPPSEVVVVGQPVVQPQPQSDVEQQVATAGDVPPPSSAPPALSDQAS